MPCREPGILPWGVGGGHRQQIPCRGSQGAETICSTDIHSLQSQAPG